MLRNPTMDRRPTGVVDALMTAMKMQNDPTNRSLTCACGLTFISGAARKTRDGAHVYCIACDAIVPLRKTLADPPLPLDTFRIGMRVGSAGSHADGRVEGIRKDRVLIRCSCGHFGDYDPADVIILDHEE
jgi:hypothetical protein